MSDQWFYIQHWKRQRWSYIGKELSYQEAKSLWCVLIDNVGNSEQAKPLAFVRKEKIYKVVVEYEKGWEIVSCNNSFLKEEPLLAQRIENEKI